MCIEVAAGDGTRILLDLGMPLYDAEGTDYPFGTPQLGFYETSEGDKPVLRWIKEDLSVRQRRALEYAVYRPLRRYGVGVCDTQFGRQLGSGLFEFRLRLRAHRDGEAALLRVFCNAAGDRITRSRWCAAA